MANNIDAYFNRLTLAVQKANEETLVKETTKLEKAVIKEAPEDTSQLRNNIYSIVDKSNYLGIIYSPTMYTRFVIEGTGIYNPASTNTTGWFYTVEDPSSKYFGTHFTMGQKPNDFPKRAAESLKKSVFTEAKKNISNAIKKL